MIDCKYVGTLEQVEMSRMSKAENKEVELVNSAKRTRDYPNVHSLVRTQYNMLKSIELLKQPIKRCIIGKGK